VASKAKKKVNEASSKKDKKKEKKKSGKEPSITDVIAVELMEKAKKSLEADQDVKREGRTPSPPPAPAITDSVPDPPTPPRINSPSESEKDDDEFNIPTISEIKTSTNLHKKELSQLQELQNRIYQTKRKLKDLDSESGEEEPAPALRSTVLSRLGVKPTENSKPSNIISLSAIRRTEKEIYVAPSFRQLIERQKVENERREERPVRRPMTRRERRSRTRSRSRERRRNRRERSRSPVRRSRSPRIRQSILQRIGSRVVVATPEKEVVKAKHRPVLSSAITGQAGKNLLLRAVAEAQRSTAGVQKKPLRDNIVVQVPIRKDKRNIRIEEEYVPESISTQSESEAEYHPTYGKNAALDEEEVIFNEEVDLEDLDVDESSSRKSPQFVVTLEGATQFDNNSKSSHSPTPPPVIKRKSIKDRIGMRPIVVSTKPVTVKASKLDERQAPKRKPVEMEIEEESESQRAYNRAKKARVSPIKFDVSDEEDDDIKSHGSSRGRRSPTPPERKESDQKKSSGDQNGEDHAKRIRLEASRSFDHVPACKREIFLRKK
jgi:zinc finger CCCH domain-containing protein 14